MLRRMFNSSELRELSHQIAQILAPVISAAVKEQVKESYNRIMPASEVADMLKISLEAVHKRCRRGTLPFHKDAAGHYYFVYTEITNHLLNK